MESSGSEAEAVSGPFPREFGGLDRAQNGYSDVDSGDPGVETSELCCNPSPRVRTRSSRDERDLSLGRSPTCMQKTG